MEALHVAKEVHLSAKSLEISEGLTNVIAKYQNLHLHPQIDSLQEDGRVLFVDGTSVNAGSIVYCTGYEYSFPFLDTKGMVVVDDGRVGPLYEHTFPPSLAPSLSFVGIPRKVLTFVFLKYGEHCGFPRLEECRRELKLASKRRADSNLETYRDSYEDHELLQKAHRSYHCTQLANEAFAQ
ncbi:hypothetical protein IFM89_007096 [Coptis chinensis]|uniref:Flavin-containing monooxygenase n=1 Tax=Coptis chinensis TaxID=261450 RepID=A0A835H214_9MAGN|nr:hypothetical protein IFM89_007096 [Coptis chinensis]